MLATRQVGRVLRALTTRRPRPPSPLRQFSTDKFPLIDPSYLVDEETIPWYDPKDFYPVRLGEVFRSRYQVIGKLGFGAYSTVWLCRDLVEHRYAAVKVCAQNAVPIKRELAAFQHLNSLPEIDHDGRQCVRHALDHFELTPEYTDPSESGDHVARRPFHCIVYEPMSMSVWAYRKNMVRRRLPLPLVKGVAKMVLLGLDYLHSHAKLIHADIQERNILFQVNDPAAFEAFEEKQRTNPCQRKLAGDRIIYTPRAIYITGVPGPPVISDFGEARFGQTTYTGVIQPVQYRAPEVIFRMPWDEKVDIWSVGVMMWDMFEGRNLFRMAENAEAETEPAYDVQLAHMIALMGPPPADLLKRCRAEDVSKYFDAHGGWIGAASIPDDSFEKSEERLEGRRKPSSWTSCG
ncbi:kinase-like domain-containing protein [Trametes punicea]|nr:kinase-like domain-containing protein [Trametes punicea]